MIATFALAHLLLALAAASHLLLTYRRPAAAVAWLFALFGLPLAGCLCYAMLAVPAGRRALRRRREAAGVRGSRHRDRAGEDDVYGDAAFATLVRQVRAFPATEGNAVDLIAAPADAFEAQLQAIGKAEREVLLATYVLKPGTVCDRLVDALADRAAAGVDVRVLIDPIGSHELPGTRIAAIRERGIRLMTFMAPNPLKGRFQINFRNHRKILAIDGELAFTGGRNWSDEYYPVDDGDEVFRDTTVRLRGPAVGQMRRVFLEDWALANGDESIDDDAPPHPKHPDAEHPDPEHRGTEHRGAEHRGTEHRGAEPARPGDHTVRVQPFGLDELRSSAIDELAGAFRTARTSIFIATPYFVPGATLQQALRTAALCGVKVELLIPRRCGKRSIDLTALHYLEKLLDAGVEVSLRGPPLMHAKAVIVDDRWSSVGSLNFDARSVHLNYELNVEVLGAGFAAELRSYFSDDLSRAEQVDPEAFRRRGWWQRIKEKAAALFEPLM